MFKPGEKTGKNAKAQEACVCAWVVVANAQTSPDNPSIQQSASFECDVERPLKN
jgi:hypothetical protein